MPKTRAAFLAAAALASICGLVWLLVMRHDVARSAHKVFVEQPAPVTAESVARPKQTTAERAGAQAPVLWLQGTDARQLLRSSEIGKVDYAALRLRTQCASFIIYSPQGKPVFAEIIKEQSAEKGFGALLVGSGTLPERETAFERSRANCDRIFGTGDLSPEEDSVVKVQPEYKRFQAVAQQALSDNNAVSNGQRNEALSTVVKAPMFGVLEATLYSKLDVSDLSKKVGEEQAEMLRTQVVTLVLCKFGDDCGRHGIVTDQFCWQYGVCGDVLETEILQNLTRRGFSASAVHEFATDVYSRLQSRDFSQLRR